MGRLILVLIPIVMLAACGGPQAVSPPLAVADEHPHFANCAAYIQASMPATGAEQARADALQRCLQRNANAAQVATRL